MTIKLENIKVGDKVVIEATVESINLTDESRYPLGVHFGNDKRYNSYIGLSGIIEHKPKPREFVVGDEVTNGGRYQGKIIALYNDLAWVQVGLNDPITWHVANLKHV